MLRIAVQSKGRLFDDTMNLLAEADIKISSSKRTLLVQSTNFPIEVLYLRDDDIPQSVATGVADIGIVGENEFCERGEDADIVERTIDSTLYVIRAGRFNRHRLGELSPIEIINGTRKPQYIILNGVNVNVRYGYAYSHKYKRSEEDKNIVELSKTSILLNKIIFRKQQKKS